MKKNILMFILLWCAISYTVSAGEMIPPAESFDDLFSDNSGALSVDEEDTIIEAVDSQVLPYIDQNTEPAVYDEIFSQDSIDSADSPLSEESDDTLADDILLENIGNSIENDYILTENDMVPDSMDQQILIEAEPDELFTDGESWIPDDSLLEVFVSDSGSDTSVDSASGRCGEGVNWSYSSDTGTLQIFGNGEITQFSYSSDYAWNDFRKEIVSLEIQEGVTNVPFRAFEYCDSLVSVKLPESLTYIGSETFYSCPELLEICIPDGVEEIGNRVFYCCSKLRKAALGNHLVNIGSNAFDGCTGLAEVILPESLESMGTYAFSGCSSLEEITIPNRIRTIPNYCFSGCQKLKIVHLPESVNFINFRAFINCKSLTDIKLPPNLSSIGEDAFSGCTSLTEMEIPDHVYQIGRMAFYNCQNLRSVYIPMSVTSIGLHAFTSTHQDFVIDCYSGTEAYKYAVNNGHTYQLLDIDINLISVRMENERTIRLVWTCQDAESVPGYRILYSPSSMVSSNNSAVSFDFEKNDVTIDGNTVTCRWDYPGNDSVVYLKVAPYRLNSYGDKRVAAYSMERYAVPGAKIRLPEESWSFYNYGEDFSYKDYSRYFGAAFAKMLSLVQGHMNGVCAGITRSVIAKERQFIFRGILCSEVDLNASIEPVKQLSARELIKNYQMREMRDEILFYALPFNSYSKKFVFESRYEDFYQDLLNYTRENGDPLELVVVHKGNKGSHSILPVGILDESNTRVRVLIYDSNTLNPNLSCSNRMYGDYRILELIRTNGKCTGFVYDFGNAETYRSGSGDFIMYRKISDSEIGDSLKYDAELISQLESTTVMLFIKGTTITVKPTDLGDTLMEFMFAEAADSEAGDGRLFLFKPENNVLTIPKLYSSTPITIAAGKQITTIKLTGSAKIEVNYAERQNPVIHIERTDNHDSYLKCTVTQNTYRQDGTDTSTEYSFKTSDSADITIDDNTADIIGSSYLRIERNKYDIDENGEDILSQPITILRENLKPETEYHIEGTSNSDTDLLIVNDPGPAVNTPTPAPIPQMKAPSAPKVTAVSTGLKLSWNKVSGAASYTAYRKKGSTVTKLGTVKTTTFTDKKAINGTQVTYYVTASRSGYKTSSKSKGTAYIYLAVPKNLTVKSTKTRTAVAAWKKNVKGTGYQIRYSLKSNMTGAKTVKVTKAGTLKKMISSLKKGKTYYFQIRTYKKTGNKTYFSAWSGKKKVKIK